MRENSRRAAVAVMLAFAVTAGGALASYPDDPPDDPDYDRAEDGGPEACLQYNVNQEQRWLFDFMPKCAPHARDPEGASGSSVNRAWREFTTGRADVLVAYVEGGVNWHFADAEEFVNRTFLNAGELPPPTTPRHDGRLNVEDFADTPDANGNGFVDPEDVIVRFEDGVDDDRNGYTDDVSGWDFVHDQNDPQTNDSAYGHANGQLERISAEADNARGGAGICPQCTLLPIKAGTEALALTDDLAQAWLYAADMGSDVLVSVTADLGYSTFMRRAVEHGWDRGMVMVEASNDFNTKDHQGGMFWPHVLPGNAVVSDSHGIPGPAANAATTTYRARSGPSSWGPKNMFSPAGSSGTTSTNTPILGGLFALLLAWGKDVARPPLTNAEAIQVMRAATSDISGDPRWPSKPGFDGQFGHGRPNVHKAMAAVAKGDIPPVAWIDAPAWYSIHDPLRVTKVPVSGHVDAPRSERAFSWRLEFAPGDEPDDEEFMTAARGTSRDPVDGRLGSIDLSRIPRSFWTKPYALSKRMEQEATEQYTVTLRLRVVDADGRVGEERRAIAVHHDPTLRPGFPRRIGPGGESQPALADLQGRGRLAIVFGDADGRVHALDGRTARPLPGFPVSTRRTRVERPHDGIAAGHEPVFNNVAIGDLDGDGRQWIVASSVAGRTYVWDDRGQPRSGGPKIMRTGVGVLAKPRPRRPRARLPIQGSSAPPVLHDLDADGRLDILQAGFDGHLHAWDPDGRPLPGWPVDVRLPDDHAPPPGYAIVEDERLSMPPTVADLDGDGTAELVIRDHFTDFSPTLAGAAPVSHLHAYRADGTRVAGWPVEVPGVIALPGSGVDNVGEGNSPPVAADVDGDGADEIAFAPAILSPTHLIEGDGSVAGVYGPLPDATLSLLKGEVGVAQLLAFLENPRNLPADTPVNFTTGGAFGRFGDAGTLTYAEPGTGASGLAGLALPGSGIPITNYVRAYGARGGDSRAGFPARMQGLDFVGSPAIADTSGDGRAEILVGSDTSTMHAYSVGGRQAEGFPKFTNGWQVWGPAVGDLDSDGDVEVVAATREGYLFAWRTEGRAAANREWWAYRHDERNTARYGIDTRPPGVPRGARIVGRELRFRAPGDDWYAGRAARYELVVDGARKPAAEPPGAAGAAEVVTLPPGAARITVRAVDDAGNRGRLVTLRRR
jgi:Subtilase family